MTPRERLLTVLKGRVPDCVPCAPDISGMISVRLTGKPFWDVYLYNDPPVWEAYIDACKYFDCELFLDGFFPLILDGDMTAPFLGGMWSAPWEDSAVIGRKWETFIVSKNDERIVTQACYMEGGKRIWDSVVSVYDVDSPPSLGVLPGKIGLAAVPKEWQELDGVKEVDMGPEGLKKVKEMAGEQGLVGVYLATSCVFYKEEDIYKYYDN